MNKIQQIKLKFDKFKPQRSEFLTKFAHQIKTEVIKMFTKSIYQSDILLAKFSLAHRQIKPKTLMQAYKKRNLKLTRSFRHSAFASDSKIIKFGQDNLKFTKFKLQIIKFLTKFSL